MNDTSQHQPDGENPVDQIIADFLEAVERGEAPSPQEYLARHPELASELSEFFAGYSQFHREAPEVVVGGGRQDSEESALSLTDPSTPTLRYAAGTEDDIARLMMASSPVRYMGDYELLDEVARGGMGVVFKARQTSLNRVVALKMILAGTFASAEEVKRFQLEAEAAAQLDHPGIVPIYEVGQHEGHHYFSMGFVDGSSLARRLIEGPLPPREAAEIVRQVAEAVQYAHSKGVVHRDLKPGNILIDRQGHPRVTDFGLAKRLESGSDLTGTGQILGTPSYMPPEQAAGHMSAVGPLSDVYSLGAILFCSLTGRPPFQAANPLDTLLQVQRQEPVSLRSLNEKIPTDLETIALKCLDKSPARRYASAHDLADELQRFLDGQPILGRPVSRLERTWRWCRRNPAIAALEATVAATLVIATIVSGGYARSEHARAISEAKAKAEVIRQSKRIQDDAATIQEQSANIQREHEAAQQELAKAQLAEARALRMSGRPGQRFGALRAIRESMKISGPTRALADEAAAALCLPDWEVDFEWDGFPPGTRRLTLSPTFDRYARVDDQNVISIRSLPEDQELATIKAPAAHDDYAGIRFSDDGRFLFERFQTPYRARAWLLTEKSPRLIADESSAWADTLDGRHIVIARGANLCVVDSAGEHPDRMIPVPHDMTGNMWRGLYGRSLIATNYGSTWQTVDLMSGKLGSLYSAPEGLAAWPAFHFNESSLVWTHNRNHSGSLHDLRTGQRLAPLFLGHKTEGIVTSSTPSRCGTVALTNDWNSILRMWDLRTGRSMLNRPFVNSNNWTVVSRDDRRVGPEVVGNKARWLRFATGREFGSLAASADRSVPAQYIDACALSHDGRLLAFGTTEGLVLHDVQSGLPLATFAPRRKDLDHIVGFTDAGHLVTVENRQMMRRTITRPDEQSIRIGEPQSCGDAAQIGEGLLVRASCSRDGSVLGLPLNRAGATLIRMQARADSGVPVKGTGTRVGSELDVRCASVSPDGKWLATGQHWVPAEQLSAAVKVWDASTGTLRHVLNCRGLCNVSFAPSGRYLMAHSGETAECRVFDTNSWTLIGKFLTKANGVFSPDDSLFAVESGPGEISLRCGPELNEFARLAAPDEHTYRPIVITPDNSRLFACNLETLQVHVWNLSLIREGLNELGLAERWPDISTASTPDVTPPLPRVLFDKPATSSPPPSNVASQSKPVGSSTTKPQPQKQYSVAEQLALFEKNIELQQWSLALTTSHLRARLQRWPQAAEDFKVLVNRNPEQHLYQYQLLILLAHLRDETAFRAHSKKALALFANDPQPFVRDRIAKACFLAPQCCDEIERAYELVDRRVADPGHQGMIEWFAIARGWMLLLKGEHEAAITTLEAGLRETHANPDYSMPQTLLLLAMAHKASGNVDTAASTLDDAMKRIVSTLPAPGNAELPAAFWHDWLTIQMLLREAQTKVLGKELTFAQMVERTGETPFQPATPTNAPFMPLAQPQSIEAARPKPAVPRDDQP